jgi:hypothetical protein
MEREFTRQREKARMLIKSQFLTPRSANVKAKNNISNFEKYINR